MVQCHNCGAQVADGTAACPECGVALANRQGNRGHQQGQPRQGQPAQGQPAHGQPAQGEPAHGQPTGGRQRQPQQRGPAQGRPTAGPKQSRTAPGKSKAVSAIFVFWSVILAIFGIIYLAFAGMASNIYGTLGNSVGSISTGLALVFFLLAAVDFSLGYGLWNVKQWGWYGGVIVSVLALLGNVLLVAQGDAVAVPVFLLLVTLFCIWSLWDERRHYAIDI